MPVYEYECSACEKILEVQQRITDDPLKICSMCGGELKKLLSRSAFHLKGGGWYSDGYSSVESGSKKSDTKKDCSLEDKGGEKTGKANKTASSAAQTGKCESCPPAPLPDSRSVG